MNQPGLRVAVVGAGKMGSDHIRRLATVISGAEAAAVIEPDETRAQAAQAMAPHAQVFSRLDDALDQGAVDAVIVAAPGFLHEAVLLPALEAGLPILCEKPLTPDPMSSWRVLEAEQAAGNRLIQVGFMRRFDREHQQLRHIISEGDSGELLMLRCAHRNPRVPDDYVQEMLITDSVVHEFDSLPWMAGSDLASVEVRFPRRNSLTPQRLNEPILVLMELANGVLIDLEMNVSVQFGYQVTTEAVFEQGLARIGEPSGVRRWQAGNYSIDEHQNFATRFGDAYDDEVQKWVDAAREKTIAGPSAWDGYKVALACEKGVTALRNGGVVPVDLPQPPLLYANTDGEEAS